MPITDPRQITLDAAVREERAACAREREEQIAAIDAAVRAARQNGTMPEASVRALLMDWVGSEMASAPAVWGWCVRPKAQTQEGKARREQSECEFSEWLREGVDAQRRVREVLEWAARCHAKMRDGDALNPMEAIPTQQGPQTWIDILLSAGFVAGAWEIIENIPGSEWPAHWALLLRLALNPSLKLVPWEDEQMANVLQPMMKRQNALNAEARAVRAACEDGQRVAAKELASDEQMSARATTKRI